MKSKILLTIIIIILVSVSGNLTAQVIDKDGYNYDTVTIGAQQWFAENLDVTHFRNGDTITEIEDATEWQQAATEGKPAWCYYNSDPTSGIKFHKLYNWYAVNDPRGLAPDGFHVPSAQEWLILARYLGGEDVAGVKLKAGKGWDGTNAAGFTALPGGYRNYSSEFVHVSEIGSWWSSTQANSTDAWSYSLASHEGIVSKSYDNKRVGLSVRCLKD